MQPQDFPLAWPQDRSRTLACDRIAGRFKIAFSRAYDALLDEAEKLHDSKDWDVIVSANVPLGVKGLPVLSATGGTKIADPGVCLYVWREDRPYAVACDTYLEIRHNVRAIWATIRALRTIQRHATSALLAQSMVGFCREIEAVEKPAVKLIAAGLGG